MRKNLIASGVIVLVAVLGLTGCGVPSAPAGDSSPTPASAPSVAPPVDVEPTPTVTPEIGTALYCEIDATGVQVCTES